MNRPDLHFKIGGLDRPEIVALLEDHLAELAPTAPVESRHALNLEQLRQADVTFWSAWDESALVGCGALKELDAEHAEIKSMRTVVAHLRTGVGSALLKTILFEARNRGYRRLSLETGSMNYFAPARELYRKFGFETCGPFNGYVEDPNSVFMTIRL
jgi:putative acetyltransferase